MVSSLSTVACLQCKRLGEWKGIRTKMASKRWKEDQVGDDCVTQIERKGRRMDNGKGR